MPENFRPRVFRPPLVAPETRVREAPDVSFADLLRMMAEGVADAQTSLDKASADMVVEFAQTTVKVVPRITEIIDAKGNITYKHAEAQEISLLDLGVSPTFYQFSDAKVEVAMDLKIVENSTESGNGKKRYSMFAETANIRFERKLNRDVKVSSKLSATLIPVPKPLRLEPERVTTTPDTE